MSGAEATAESLRDGLTSSTHETEHLQSANVVDGLFAVARAIEHLATAVDVGLDGISDSLSAIAARLNHPGAE